MGYGGSLENAGKIIGKVNDEGIDGIIREDKLGFDTIYIQAKKWERGKMFCNNRYHRRYQSRAQNCL